VFTLLVNLFAEKKVKPLESNIPCHSNSKLSVVRNAYLEIAKKVIGTSERPRLCFHVSGRNLDAQIIDDSKGVTLYALSTLNKDLRSSKLSANIKSATILAEHFGKNALSNGVKQVVFDRNGRRYHGIVKAFADAVRQTGIQF